MVVAPSVARAAATIPSVNGIALGMTSQNVMHRLRDRGVRATVIARRCLADYLSAHRKVMSIEDRSGHCVEQIWWRDSGEYQLVLFEDLPRRPGVSIVTSISLNYPEDPKRITDVVRDAGLPSLTDGKRPWTAALWCFGFKCNDMVRTVNNQKSPPILLVRKGGFTFDDARAATERKETIRRELHVHGVVLKP